MPNYQLKSRLKHLTLAGYTKEEGYEWIGKESDWRKVQMDDYLFETLSI